MTELRTAKQKVSRQLRDRDEELDEHRRKCESLRQEIRKTDKGKREVGMVLMAGMLGHCTKNSLDFLYFYISMYG